MLEILSWNVNGLRAVMKKGFVDFLSSESPDIICLQETKTSEMPIELYQAEGYHAYLASGEKKGYSGVGLYCRREPDREAGGEAPRGLGQPPARRRRPEDGPGEEEDQDVGLPGRERDVGAGRVLEREGRHLVAGLDLLEGPRGRGRDERGGERQGRGREEQAAERSGCWHRPHPPST